MAAVSRHGVMADISLPLGQSKLWKLRYPMILSCLSFTELEQQHLKELEAHKSRLDQEASAKLAELNNR